MSLRDKIEALAAGFSSGVLALIRECSLEELMGGEVSVPAAIRTERPARAKKSSGRLARRSPEDIEKAADDIVALLKGKKDGMRAEEIRKTLGIDKREWARPLQAALDSKRLKKSGEKRATVYSVSGAGGSAGASAKPAKKKPAKKTAKKSAPKAKAKSAKPKAKSVKKKSSPKAAKVKANGAAAVTKTEHAAAPAAE